MSILILSTPNPAVASGGVVPLHSETYVGSFVNWTYFSAIHDTANGNSTEFGFYNLTVVAVSSSVIVARIIFSDTWKGNTISNFTGSNVSFDYSATSPFPYYNSTKLKQNNATVMGFGSYAYHGKVLPMERASVSNRSVPGGVPIQNEIIEFDSYSGILLGFTLYSIQAEHSVYINESASLFATNYIMIPNPGASSWIGNFKTTLIIALILGITVGTVLVKRRRYRL